MSVWLKLAAVAAGGGAGACLRYLMTTGTDQLFGRGFPHGTLVVNVVGSLLIGYVLEWLPQAQDSAPYLKLMLVTGLLGGFTTYSAFSVETLRLAQEGFLGRALLNIGLTLALCLVSVWLGYLAGRALHGTA